MKRWLYYNKLAFLDLVRLWPATQHHVIIVAGICLPILLLFGLKQGLVAELRHDLLTSPTGRQIVFWSAQRGELLTGQVVADLEAKVSGIELIIPETQRVVGMMAPNGRRADTMTIYSTRSGDPVLGQAGGDVLRHGERGIVLMEPVARQLSVKVGDTVTVQITRENRDAREQATVALKVRAIVQGEVGAAAQSQVGYADYRLLEKMEQFVRGHRVAEFNWPASKSPAREAYAGYLLFCERTADLTKDDRQQLADRGLAPVEATADILEVLKPLLVTNKFDRLKVYSLGLRAGKDKTAAPSFRLSPSEITEMTAADDVAIPWNLPMSHLTPAGNLELIGFSLPKRSWLREYFNRPGLAFDFDSETLLARRDADTAPETPIKLTLSSGTIASIPWQSVPVTAPTTPAKSDKPSTVAAGIKPEAKPKATPPPATKPSGALNGPKPNTVPPTASKGILKIAAVVPVNLLAYLVGDRSGKVEYDPTLRMFVPVAEPIVHDKARLFARSIDDVPEVVKALQERHFAVLSESGRISEIHRQDRSLQVLVLVVGAGVFIFGVFTVVSVLIDSTDRKRGTIGILRVMGVSKTGVFYIVFVRAAAIGLLAGLLSFGFGTACAWFLGLKATAGTWLDEWKPNAQVLLTPDAIAFVFAGATLCCMLGAIYPAWRASRLDPFDAIVEGRFH